MVLNMDTSTSLSAESLPKNANSHGISEVIEAAENLELSCNNEDGKDIEESEPHGTELPPELWIKIFKYLPQYQLFKTLRLVCTEWRDMVDCPALWRVVDFQTTETKEPFLLYLSERSDNIQSVTLSGSSLSDSALSCALERMPSLKNLSLDFCNCLNLCDNHKGKIHMPQRYAQPPGRACSSCASEGVHNRFGVLPNSGISSCTLAAIGQHCPQLTFLDLSGQHKVTDDALQAIARGCKKLCTLKLVYCRGSYTTAGIDAIAKNCTSLRVLRLDAIRSAIFYSLDLNHLAKGCPKLRCLSLSGIKGQGSGCVAHLLELRHFKNLTYLDLGCVQAVNDDVVINLVKNLKKIKKLKLSFNNIHDIAVKALALEGQYLKRVNLVGCKITEQALYYICHMSNSISVIKVGHCEGIKDSGIYRIHRKDRCEFLKPCESQHTPLVNERLVSM